MTESDIVLTVDLSDPDYLHMSSEELSIHIMSQCRKAGIPVIGFMRLDGVTRGRMIVECNSMTDVLTIKWSPQ